MQNNIKKIILLNVVNYGLVFVTILYFAKINFNLSFMTRDELDTIVNQIDLFHLLNNPRSNSLFSYLVSQVTSFSVPDFSGLIPRFISMILLFISLILTLKIFRIQNIYAIALSSFILISHEIDWQHNGFVAYFGNFNIYLSSFLLYVVLLNRKVNKFNNVIIIILILISFSTEYFIGLLIVILITIKLLRLSEFNTRIMLIPLIFLLLIFTFSKIGYVDGSTEYMQNYVIGSVETFTYNDILKGIGIYFINSIPLISLSNINTIESGYILIGIFMSMSIFIIYDYLYNRNKIITKIDILYLIIILNLMFIPSVLISLQPMKLSWALSGSSVKYVFSLYTWIGICLFLFLFLNIYKEKFRIPKRLIFILILFMILFTFKNAKNNIEFTNYYKDNIMFFKYIKIQAENAIDNHVTLQLPEKYPFITQVDNTYIKKYVKKIYHLETDFLIRNFMFVQELKGFSIEENDGCWIETENSEIIFSEKIKEYTKLRIKIKDVFYFKDKNVTFKIGSQIMNKNVLSNDVIIINLNKNDDNSSLFIKMDNLVSPMDKGISKDRRTLGIKIESVELN